MEELIAKSKAAKAAKAMQKEEDLTATDVLDTSFESLLRAGDLLALLKEKGAKHARASGQASQALGDEDAEFDRMRRELAFESRAKVRSQAIFLSPRPSLSCPSVCLEKPCLCK